MCWPARGFNFLTPRREPLAEGLLILYQTGGAGATAVCRSLPSSCGAHNKTNAEDAEDAVEECKIQKQTTKDTKVSQSARRGVRNLTTEDTEEHRVAASCVTARIWIPRCARDVLRMACP